MYSLVPGTNEYENFISDLADALVEWDNQTTPMENIDWTKSLKDLYVEQVEFACIPIIQKLMQESANAE